MVTCYWLQAQNKLDLSVITLHILTTGWTFWDWTFLVTAVNTDTVDNSFACSYTYWNTCNTNSKHTRNTLHPSAVSPRAAVCTYKHPKADSKRSGMHNSLPSLMADLFIRLIQFTKKKTKVAFPFFLARILIFHFSELVCLCDRMDIKTGSRQMKGIGSQELVGIRKDKEWCETFSSQNHSHFVSTVSQ